MTTSTNPTTVQTVTGSPRTSAPAIDRDGGVEVGDRGGAHRADLAHQREEQHERRGRADHGQRDAPTDHVGRRQRAGYAVGQEHHGDVGQRRERQGRGHDPDPGQPLEGSAEDGRPRGVPDDDDAHLGDGAEVGAADVEPDQGGDADDPEDQAQPGDRRESFGVPGGERDRDPGQRARRPPGAPWSSSAAGSRRCRGTPTGWRSRRRRTPAASASAAGPVGPRPGRGRAAAGSARRSRSGPARSGRGTARRRRP